MLRGFRVLGFEFGGLGFRSSAEALNAECPKPLYPISPRRQGPNTSEKLKQDAHNYG